MSIKHRKAASRPRAAAPQKRSVWKSLLRAFPITLIMGLLLLLFCAAFLLLTDDPDRFSGVAGLVALYLTALLGGVTVSRVHGQRAPLLCGLAEGGLLFLLLTLAALFLPDTHYANEAKALLLRAPVAVLAIVGALWGSRKKTPRRRRKAAGR